MNPGNRLIIFFIPPEKIVNGGVLSIFSLCKESRRFESIHKAEVVLCTYPGHPTYKRNDLFENDERVYSFQEIVELYPKLDYLLIHLPELALNFFYDGVAKYEPYLEAVHDLEINIMNQNIKYMPDQSVVAGLYKYTSSITQTTAHDRYATQEVCDKYAVPLHHLSVFIDSGQYVRTNFADKADVIAYSRDKHPFKAKIIDKVRSRLKDYKLIEIDNLSYSEYKELMQKAKFIITFGEGLDGYFIEGIFSGGIAFASYNEDFFPADFKKYPNVYKNYESMIENICVDIKSLDDEAAYRKLNELLFKKLDDLYSFKNYIRNLGEFYKGHYSFLPDKGSLEKFFAESLKQKDKEIEWLSVAAQSADRHKADIDRYKTEVHEANLKYKRQAQILADTYNSYSWKITKPLRLINGLINKVMGSSG